MARQSLNFGQFDNDPSADKAREGAAKIEANFVELYAAMGGKAPLVSPAFTGASTFGGPVTVNAGLQIGAFATSGQFRMLGDNSIGRVLDFDFTQISSQSGEWRFGRGTNTSGSTALVVYRADGTSTADHRLASGTAGTIAALCRNGGGLSVGHTASVAATLDVNATALIRGAAGTTRELRFGTAGALRWNLRANASAESGSNGGSNFELLAYDDPGAGLRTQLQIIRASGHAVYFGNWTCGTDNGFTLGGASNRWSVVYAGTGTINTSDAREKTPVRPFNAAEIAAARDLIAEIGIYQWLAAIAEKGEDSARLHVGLTVQRAIEIMEGHGLDPWRYGFICRDEVTRKVKIQQTQVVTEQQTEPDDGFDTVIEVRDGVPTLVQKARPPKPVFRMEPVLDESGEQVMEPVERQSDLLDQNGQPAIIVEMRPALHPVPVMVEREETIWVEIDEPDGDRLGFRPDQLDRFMLRGLLARVEALEG
ncbi:hypothetical protein ASE63_22480 [Bosea sp. Root381]|uniref:tail fiber domain-containing protein n=1 Tax=Bosea sp. Root381 TaxID=1736524 RepID=UPI000701FE34|nr:tail fiber domain-containing protein [Bosea sp. Root381]KRE07469.1 hypothetical protein ASE63_22480 [Bosea sp. Root381]